MQTFLTRRGRTTAVAASAAALLLTACSSGSTTADDPSPTPVVGLDAIYAQDLDWTDCGDLECADVVVPMDWNEPDGDTIAIAVNRRAATGERIGSLLVNPGGPGASGLDLVENFSLYGFGAAIGEQYDIIGFDPRGVGESEPVTCLDDDALDAYFASDTTDDEAGYAESVAQAAAFNQACLDATGPFLQHVGTIQAAKDMDVLRAVLGEDSLDYLGFSYGTFLGTTYAALFPERVGRMVLDGAVDPGVSAIEDAKVQAAGFENAMRAYVADCLAGSTCPLTGTVDDGVAQIVGLLDSLAAAPLPTGDDDRPLTAALGFLGLIQPLYAQEVWPYLTMSLDAAINEGDGSMLLYWADYYLDRGEDGHYTSNANSAIVAVNCADSGPTELTYAEYQAQVADIATVAPTMAAFFAGPTCPSWPVAAEGTLDDYSAAGSAPILVVGTTNDPATPYVWAQGLTATLESATLLTYQGEGHTAYGSSNSCVLDAVDAYLIDGTVPAEGTTC